jgi:hypothetical protein
MTRLQGPRSRLPRALLALPVAGLAAVFALGVPDGGSGAPCASDADCPAGELCGADVCESAGGGCGGDGSSLQAGDGAQEQGLALEQAGSDLATVGGGSSTPSLAAYPNPKKLPNCPANPRGKDCDDPSWSTPLGWSCQYNDPSVGPTVCTCEDSLLPEWLGGTGPALHCEVRTLDPFRSTVQ